MGQRMALFNGNIDYNNNTICWDSLSLIVSTKSISGSFLTELLGACRSHKTMNIGLKRHLRIEYSSRIPSLVKILYQDQSAENQNNQTGDYNNTQPKFELGFSETMCVTSYDKNNEQFGH